MAEQPVWFSRRRAPQTKDLDADDPYELVGIRYPVTPGDDADHMTARTLVEEFALQGWSPRAITGLFADPNAGHANGIYRRLGGPMLAEIVGEVFRATERTT